MQTRMFWRFVEEELGKLPHFLIYAFLECLIIVLLFVDGFLSFLSNEIAAFFELKIPCLLCTRIDHVLVYRNPSFYYNESICDVHKKDISSLAFCNAHKKLSDIRSMCQGCLLSSAAEKDSDFGKYRTLVGILHKDSDLSVEDDRRLISKPLKKDDPHVFLDNKSRCSCCGESIRSRSSTRYNRSLSLNVPTPAPSPRAHFFSGRNEEGSSKVLQHIRYTELKFMPEADAELHKDEDHVDNCGSKDDAKSATISLLAADSVDVPRTPIFGKGNKFFGIPLSDSAQASPRCCRAGGKLINSKRDFIMEGIEEEVDGDSLAHLRSQVHSYRKSLLALHMELDEERSAAAVAANNAMAMITRLQTEKAAVQMDALQYQRMMEEQAEYDQEALQVIKDSLLKREEDFKALEVELEAYRERFGEIRRIVSDICEIDADEEHYHDMQSQSFYSLSDSGSSIGADQNDLCIGHVDSEPPVFDGQGSYLLCLLKDLEEKLHTPPIKIFNSSELFSEKNEDEGKDNENEGILRRELALIREKVRAIEAERNFLKHIAMSTRQGDEGTKLLIEIAHHLRRLRQPVISLSDYSKP